MPAYIVSSMRTTSILAVALLLAGCGFDHRTAVGPIFISTLADHSESERISRQAAAAGDVAASVNVAAAIELRRDRLADGSAGTAAMSADAVRLYRAAAEQGDAVGQTNLGVVCLSSKSGTAACPGGEADAATWLYRAMQQGNLKAMVYYAYMIERGLGGLRKDGAAAAQLYRTASNRGEPLGAEFLGKMER